MFINFSQVKTNYRLFSQKGQIAPFLIAILAIIVMAIMVTVNLGKIGIYKTRTSNAADAAALAAASSMAASFDILAAESVLMYTQYLDYQYNADKMRQIAQDRYDEAIEYYRNAIRIWLAIAVLAYIPFGIGWGLYLAGGVLALVCMAYASKNWMTFYHNDIKNLVDIMNGCHDRQSDFYQAIWNSMQTAVGEATNAAYNLAFANFAIDLKEGQPEAGPSFPWTDGQGRRHEVRVGVGLDTPRNFSIYVTNEDIEYINHKYRDMFWPWFLALTYWSVIELNSSSNLIAARHIRPCGHWRAWHVATPPPASIPCIVPRSCIRYSLNALQFAAEILIAISTFAEEVEDILQEIWNAFQENGTRTFSSGDAGNEILVTLQDVRHSRRLSVDTFQQHQGEDLGLWRTEYPDIESSARASFAGGVIDGKQATTNHTPELIR